MELCDHFLHDGVNLNCIFVKSLQLTVPMVIHLRGSYKSSAVTSTTYILRMCTEMSMCKTFKATKTCEPHQNLRGFCMSSASSAPRECMLVFWVKNHWLIIQHKQTDHSLTITLFQTGSRDNSMNDFHEMLKKFGRICSKKNRISPCLRNEYERHNRNPGRTTWHNKHEPEQSV